VSTYLVRHAKAGSRKTWDGDDFERPVSPTGRKQADAMAARLVDAGLTSLWSSPYVRCIETLEPLADLVGLPIQTDERLAEGARFEDTLELLEESGEGAVLCTHGDVLQEVAAALTRRGTRIVGEADWRKGTIWVLEREGEAFGTARPEPPPA
jgi:8-oxo-dGTP diphosphatase